MTPYDDIGKNSPMNTEYVVSRLLLVDIIIPAGLKTVVTLSHHLKQYLVQIHFDCGPSQVFLFIKVSQANVPPSYDFRAHGCLGSGSCDEHVPSWQVRICA